MTTGCRISAISRLEPPYGFWFWDKYTHNLGLEIEGMYGKAEDEQRISGTTIRGEWQHYGILLTLKYGKPSET
jgi:hypothetical protein